MKNKKQLKLEYWLKEHPAKRVNHSLRQLLTHYIGFFPEDTISGLQELVLDITDLMELLDAADDTSKGKKMNLKKW